MRGKQYRQSGIITFKNPYMAINGASLPPHSVGKELRGERGKNKNVQFMKDNGRKEESQEWRKIFSDTNWCK